MPPCRNSILCPATGLPAWSRASRSPTPTTPVSSDYRCSTPGMFRWNPRPVRSFSSYKGQRHHSGQVVDRHDRHLGRLRVLAETRHPHRARLRRRHRRPGLPNTSGCSGPTRPANPARTPRTTSPASPTAPRGCSTAAPHTGSDPVTRPAFDATRTACDLMDWQYEVVGTPPEPLRSTCTDWLATGTRAISWPPPRTCARCSANRWS
jgi:hypothetical protein